MDLAAMLGEDPNYVPSPQQQQQPSTTTNKNAGQIRSVMLKPAAARGTAASRDQRRLVENNARKLQRERAMNRGRAGMAEAPSSSTATAAAPQRMAKRPSSFNTAKRMAAAGNERMERLRKFQDERARKRAEVRANEPKVPFYVGVYKLETHNKRVAPVPASHKSTVARGRTLTRATTTKPPEAPKKKEATAAAARMSRARPTRLAPGAAKTTTRKANPAAPSAAAAAPRIGARRAAAAGGKATPKQRRRRKTSTPDSRRDLAAVSPAISVVSPTPAKKPASPPQELSPPPPPQPQLPPSSARRRSSRIAASVSLKSEEDIAAEKKFLRAAVTPVRQRRRSRSRSPTSSLAPPTPTPSKRQLQMEPLEEEDEEKEEGEEIGASDMEDAPSTVKRHRRKSEARMTPGSSARRSASRRGTRRSLWEDIEAVGKQATSLTPLIEVLTVSKQAEAANATAAPPNLIVPKEFNFGGSIASSITTQDVAGADSSADVVVETAEVEPGIVRFTATPRAFKTPTAPRSARKSRRSHSALCITERGSNSDKRRKKRGLDPFGGFLDFSGIPMDPMSPLHSTIKDRLQKGDDPDEILNDSRKLIDFDNSISSEASTPPTSILRNSIYVGGGRSNVQDTTAATVIEGGPEDRADAAQNVAEMPSTDPLTAEHFRNLLTSETARLTAMCEKWEAKVTSGPSDEDVAGQVRTTIGQARLLMNKKGRFEQFSGLVDSCANGTGEKKTTVMDLQGFWDLMAHTVENTDKEFEELARLEANGWQKSAKENAKPKKSAAVKRKATTAVPTKTTAAAGGASKGLKAMLAAKRREMMAAKAKDEEDSTAAVVAKKMKTPEVARESGAARSSLLLRAAVGAVEADGGAAAEKVFEGGFFSVRSPMAAAASSRSPLQRITPTNTPCGGGGLTGGSTNNSSRRRSARKSNVASTSMILAASAAGKINFDEIGGNF